MDISFSFAAPTYLPKRKRLKSFIQEIFTTENVSAAMLSIVFCSDEYLLSINRTFLQHDYYTDIITFDLTGPESEALSGEIYISIDMIKLNAKEFKTSLQAELRRVIFHGVLHLCGYNDNSKKARALMTQKENHYLHKFELF